MKSRAYSFTALIMTYLQVMTIIEKVPQLVKSMTGVDIAKSVGGGAMS